MAFHYHFTKHLRVGLHLNVAHVALPCVDILYYISYARNFQNTILLVGLDGESAVIFRHGSHDKNGVGTIKQYDVGKWHWL